MEQLTVRESDGEGLDRRELLRHAAALGGLAVTGPAFLAACPAREEDTLDRARRLGYARLGIAHEVPYGFSSRSPRTTRTTSPTSTPSRRSPRRVSGC